MCFGPVVANGYGVCYNPMNDHINFAISAFNACEETNAAHLAQAVQDALLDMRTLLEQSPRSKLWRAPQLFTVIYMEEADDTAVVLVTSTKDRLPSRADRKSLFSLIMPLIIRLHFKLCHLITGQLIAELWRAHICFKDKQGCDDGCF